MEDKFRELWIIEILEGGKGIYGGKIIVEKNNFFELKKDMRL